MSENEKPPKPVKISASGITGTALKDHTLFAPPLVPRPIHIKKGDDLAKVCENVPEIFKAALETEGVIKKG